MRLKWNIVAFCIALSLLVVSCRTGSDSKMISEQQVGKDEFGNVWVARLFENDCDKDRHPGEAAVLDIHNNLDRNITLDFDGPTHHEISIGDKRAGTLKLEAGSYGVLINAPGLKYTPANFTYTVQGHCVYEMTWERILANTQFRE